MLASSQSLRRHTKRLKYIGNLLLEYEDKRYGSLEEKIERDGKEERGRTTSEQDETKVLRRSWP